MVRHRSEPRECMSINYLRSANNRCNFETISFLKKSKQSTKLTLPKLAYHQIIQRDRIRAHLPSSNCLLWCGNDLFNYFFRLVRNENECSPLIFHLVKGLFNFNNLQMYIYNVIRVRNNNGLVDSHKTR